MYDQRHYVPILKGKLAELTALEHVRIQDRSRMTPLVELISDDSGDVALLQSALDSLVRRLGGGWGASDRLIVDTNGAADDSPLPNGELAVRRLHDGLSEEGVQAVPTVWLDTPHAVVEEVSAIQARDKRGLCLRVVLDDLQDTGGLPEADLSALLQSCNVVPNEVDLVLDMGAVDGGSVTAYATLARMILAALPYATQWRSLTLASGAFPVNLQAFGAYSPGAAPRHDSQLWGLVSSRPLPRAPGFGDYAIAHPEAPTGGAFAPAPNLRYTTAPDWVIWKGKKGTPAGNKEFFAVCARLVDQAPNVFSGEDFSWGDEEIARCASAQGGPGGATQWRAWGTSHHLAYVIDRLATTGAP
jgi:hypothetical protein